MFTQRGLLLIVSSNWGDQRVSATPASSTTVLILSWKSLSLRFLSSISMSHRSSSTASTFASMPTNPRKVANFRFLCESEICKRMHDDLLLVEQLDCANPRLLSEPDACAIVRQDALDRIRQRRSVSHGYPITVRPRLYRITTVHAIGRDHRLT